MQAHVDEFEHIQKEIEFHSESLKPQDINIAFLLSLGDSETWKNFRNSNLHRAVKLKPSDLFAEVILIDEANVSTFSQPESAKATILPMWIWKRNSRALSTRMSKIQRTKEETQKGGWNSKNASGKTSGRHEVDKAHGGIHQCNRQIRIIKRCKNNG